MKYKIRRKQIGQSMRCNITLYKILNGLMHSIIDKTVFKARQEDTN